MIETVYIFLGVNESVQLESARKKASNHPNGLANVCFHKHYESHNEKCYTLDVNDVEGDENDG